MFERILKKIKELIKNRDYIVTTHADEEMTEDELSIYDVESVVLSGEILEKQRDIQSKESKYRLTGNTLNNEKAEVILKIGRSGKVVIITIYLM